MNLQRPRQTLTPLRFGCSAGVISGSRAVEGVGGFAEHPPRGVETAEDLWEVDQVAPLGSGREIREGNSAEGTLDLRNFGSRGLSGTEPPTDFALKRGGGCLGVTQIFPTEIFA
jgi:hypothetical protein